MTITPSNHCVVPFGNLDIVFHSLQTYVPKFMKIIFVVVVRHSALDGNWELIYLSLSRNHACCGYRFTWKQKNM